MNLEDFKANPRTMYLAQEYERLLSAKVDAESLLIDDSMKELAESELAKFPNAEMIVNGLLDANDTKFEELEKASRRNGVSEEFINAFIRDQMLGFFAKHKFAAIISELEFSVDEHGHRQAIFINPKSNEIPIDRRIYNMTEFPKKKKRK